MKKYHWHFSTALILSSVFFRAQDLQTAADSLAARYLRCNNSAALCIAIISNGQTQFFNYGGTKSGSSSRPTEHSVYDIGGLSSVLTAYLLQLAVEEKKLKYEDEVLPLLPQGIAFAGQFTKPLRLLHLVNHTSAMPNTPPGLRDDPKYDSLDPYLHFTESDLYEAVKRTALNGDPGYSCAYSTFAVGLLGCIICRQYQLPFNMLLQEKVCRPLGMTETTAEIFSEASAVLPGHDAEGDTLKAWHLPAIPGAGAVHTSAADFSKFMRQVLDKPQLREAIFEPVYSGRPNTSKGWFLARRYGHRICWQAGAGNGSRSFAAFIPERNSGLVILANASQDLEFTGLSLIQLLVQ